MGKLNLFCIFLLLTLALVSSAPPVTTVQQFPEGYVIVEAPHEYLKLNQDYQYNFFIYNSSTGLLLDNTSIICNFFLANSSGEVIYFSTVDYFIDGHWGIDISGSNFSSIGTHPYGVSCQDGYGGSLAGVFEVTYTGYYLTEAQSMLYIGLLAIMLFILFSTFYGMTYLPASNERDDEGQILSINYLKYLRLPLWIFAYFIFIAIIFISSNISLAYLNEEMFGNLLFAIYSILLALSPVIIILVVISFFVRFFHDREFQNMLNRGMYPGGSL